MKTKITKNNIIKWTVGALIILIIVLVFLVILKVLQKPPLAINQIKQTPPTTLLPVFDEPTFRSFFDSFDNDLQVDWDKTKLYYDQVSAAIMLPPKYQWQDVRPSSEAEQHLKSFKLNDFKNPQTSYDQRCLAGICLEQVGLTLMFDGAELKLPSELNKNLESLTIGTVGSRWLVGASLKEGEGYMGLVWYFDGQKFTPLLPKKVSSKYYGEWGFGGEADDFLVVYGAYKGEAWRVRGTNLQDVSHFFSYRVMDRGFKPEVIKSDTGWFVFSLSSDKSQFLKIWENESGELAGEVSLNRLVKNYQSAVFTKTDRGITALLMGSGISEYKIFIDNGFDLNTSLEVFFKPAVFESPIFITKIANSELGDYAFPMADGKISFLDGKKWIDTPKGYYVNKNVDFGPEDNIFLRATLPASKNKFFSPFLSQFVFDFYYHK